MRAHVLEIRVIRGRGRGTHGARKNRPVPRGPRQRHLAIDDSDLRDLLTVGEPRRPRGRCTNPRPWPRWRDTSGWKRACCQVWRRAPGVPAANTRAESKRLVSTTTRGGPRALLTRERSLYESPSCRAQVTASAMSCSDSFSSASLARTASARWIRTGVSMICPLLAGGAHRVGHGLGQGELGLCSHLGEHSACLRK